MVNSNNIGTTIFILFIVTLCLTGLYYVSSEVTSKNTKLDIESQALVNSMGNDYNNYGYNTTIIITEASNESNFEGVDAYVREYLEDKTEINQKETMLNKVLNFPATLLIIFGVEESFILIAFNTLVYSLLGVLIGLQIFKAIRSGETD